MSMKDELSNSIIILIQSVKSYVVKKELVIPFVVRYFKMCSEIGIEAARPKIVYHWTSTANFEAIKDGGLKVPDGVTVHHATDTGYYGRGIYASPDPMYAQGYGHGARRVFVCLSLPGRQYKATYPTMMGKGLMDNFDSHISADHGIEGMEWVFFNSDQLLLCYLVTLDFLQQKAKVQMEAVCELLEKKYLEMKEAKLKELPVDDI